MEERLGEIAGTLARTKERKNTILYKAVQRKREEEKLARLGVNRLPSNPRETDDPKVMRFVISQLRSEIGERMEKLRQPTFLSIEKDGEATVRAKNDEVNQLLVKKNAWEKKLALVTNTQPPVFQSRKVFFGCAKQLPEAVSQKRRRDDADHSSDDDRADVGQPQHVSDDTAASKRTPRGDDGSHQLTHSYYEAIAMLASEDTNSKLLPAERESEKKAKATTGSHPSGLTVANGAPSTKYINSYMEDGHLQLPDEEELKRAQVERKRQALLERLQTIKKQ